MTVNNRPSRHPPPSFPRKRAAGAAGSRIVFSVPFGIPAYAGMTVKRRQEMTVAGRPVCGNILVSAGRRAAGISKILTGN